MKNFDRNVIDPLNCNENKSLKISLTTDGGRDIPLHA